MSGPGWAVLVESNTTGHGAEMIHTARRLGLRPVLVCADPGRYPFRDDADVLVADTLDPQAVLAAVRTLGGRVALVTSTSDRFVAVAARVAGAMGLRGPDPDAVAAAQDKGAQREVLARHGVRVPRFAVVVDAAQAAGAATRIGCPVVVKPVAGSGSVGVRLCASPRAAAQQVERLLADGIDERGNRRAPRALVEQAVPGREFSVEILAGTVVGISETHVGAPPSFVETGHDHPAVLTAAQAERLTAEAVAAVGALGLAGQNAHVELRMDRADVRIIEVNPRLPGGRITTLVRLATGVDMVEGHLRHLADGDPTAPAVAYRAAAIRFLLDEPGRDRAGPPHPVPGIVETRLDRRADRVRFGDFRDRIGHVIAVAADVPTAVQRAETARSRPWPDAVPR